jgi:hypothetical protein
MIRDAKDNNGNLLHPHVLIAEIIDYDRRPAGDAEIVRLRANAGD